MYRRWTLITLAVSLLATGAGLAAQKSNEAGRTGTAVKTKQSDKSDKAGTPDKSDKAGSADRSQQKREAIDEMAGMTMDRLLAQSPQAKRLFGKSVGYAVFDNVKVAFLVSAGGGVGVAVERATRDKTYMKMGTAGIGLGAGGQSYSVVFLFEDEETLRSFVDKGWHADATATAAAGSKGTNAEATFSHGVAVYQLTNKGLMAHVDISGTKYWKNRKLNEPVRRVSR
jgi:lipid-binding SYLF domain-containing protein